MKRIAIYMFCVALTVGVVFALINDPWKEGEDARIQGDIATAVQIWIPLAEKGDAAAQHSLGLLYAEGSGAFPQDYERAKSLFQKAAKQGHMMVQVHLGYMYQMGNGGTVDSIMAHMHYNVAAESGSEEGAKLRNQIAEEMTPEQISTARQLAIEWSAKRP